MSMVDWSKVNPAVFDAVPEDPGADEEQAPGTGWDKAAAGAAEIFQDAAVPAGQDLGPAFLGKRWREITDPETKRQAWAWLREWTEWFTVEFGVDASAVPACWFMHPELVAELWALANAETRVWEEGAPSTMPLTAFVSYVPAAVERMKHVRAAQKCVSERRHVPQPREDDGWDRRLLRVDEGLWADHLASVTDQETEVEAGAWRMGARTAGGEQAYSREVEVPAVEEAEGPVVDDPFFGFDGMGRPMVRATATGKDLAQTWWEHLEDGSWVVAERSRRDVSTNEDEEGPDA